MMDSVLGDDVFGCAWFADILDLPLTILIFNNYEYVKNFNYEGNEKISL